MRRPAAIAAAVFGLLGGALLGSPALARTAGIEPPATTSVDAGVYLVVLRDAPLASYDGTLSGFPSTVPAAGHRFRAHTTAADLYRTRLLAGQSLVLSLLDDPEVLYQYTTALDGFAARLTTEQVKQAASLSDVAFVERDAYAHPTSIGSASSASGLASIQQAQLRATVGRGTVVGVIDTGIWPENPSFAGVPTDRNSVRHAYPGFSGYCEKSGADWSADLCNSKVIAARAFLAGFGSDKISVADDASPRDTSGHGSRTAAIAAGNADVDVTIAQQEFDPISGQAPGAALAIYKACWRAPDPADDGCSTADSVKAIDQAVSDGVNVISYSIGDSPEATGRVGAVETAFMNAADAGVFVAASAGDQGPGASTVAHISPWVTTVGASSTERYDGRVQLGNGRRFTGAMVSDKTIGSHPLVYAADAAASGHTARQAALCSPGSLNASRVDGAIVICDRGKIARVDKSATVKVAGGLAMILANVKAGSIDADIHAVPTVHVNSADGTAIKAYLASTRYPTATLTPRGAEADQPDLARFSSRGPDLATGGSVLKPNVTAPGVNVLAATSPELSGGPLWDLSSGTSMATPAVAGVAARVLAAHPRWSPAMVASAIVTSAKPLNPVGSPLARGAGEVSASGAADPGLVYDAGASDWATYTRAAERHDQRAVEQVNLPSISISGLIGTARITRTVTNVASTTETYTASTTGLRGLSVSVDPSSIRLAPGKSASYTVSVSARRGALYEQFSTGALTWTGSAGHRVVSPVAVRPAYVRSPLVLRASSEGSAVVKARAGVTGTVRAALIGPVAADPTHLTPTVGTFDSSNPASSDAWTASYDVDAQTAAVRFEAAADDDTDVDLYVYADGSLVASATSLSSSEAITLHNPAAGMYVVYVVAASSDVDDPSVDYTGWVLPRAARNTDTEITRLYHVTGGRTFGVDIPVGALDDDTRWFGELSFAHSTPTTDVLIN